jgi:isopenicillin-N N-acyltransferase-like protein
MASSEKQMIGIESIQDDYEMILPQNDVLVHSNNYLTERL